MKRGRRKMRRKKRRREYKANRRCRSEKECDAPFWKEGEEDEEEDEEERM